jgi:hypothetical protein
MTGINLYAENISANITLTGQTQAYTFNTIAISQYQLFNTVVPTSMVSTQNCLEFNNTNTAGYRFRQLTSNTATRGSLILEDFTTGSIPGRAILTFNENGGNTIFTPLSTATAYNVQINNVNAAATQMEYSLYQSGTQTIGIGYNATSAYGYLWAYTNVPIQIGVNNTEVLYINSSGLNMNGNAIANAVSVTAGNLELISNTLQSNNTNGNILLTPNGTGMVGIAGTPSYLFDVNGTTRIKRLLGNTNKPTVVLGSAAGASPSSTITGSETAGTFSLTAGIGATTGLIGTFTLASAMPSANFSIIFLPASSTTATVNLNIWAASTAATTFTLNCTVGLSVGTYIWNYLIIGTT